MLCELVLLFEFHGHAKVVEKGVACLCLSLEKLRADCFLQRARVLCTASEGCLGVVEVNEQER